ncbi:MAG: hypothetical protein ABJL67_23310 [Sulfitobacter sp.]
MKSILFTLALVMALPANAQTFHANNGMKVTPAGGQSFVVSGFPRNTPQSHWCAAAQYAQRFLKASYSQRMYVVGDYKRGQRQFLISLDPTGTASEGQRIKEFSVRIDGANRRVDEGLDFCASIFLRDSF